MQCPKCSQEIRKESLPDGSSVFYCPACGWGRDRAMDARKNPRDSGQTGLLSPGIMLKLVFFWLISFLIVCGPYGLLVYGLPWLIESRGWEFVGLSLIHI